MKSCLLAFILCLSASLAQARLGETRAQTETRYGLPKSERTLKGLQPLIPGARELTFHFAGFRIRCAFLPASDGVEYIFREEYAKLVPSTKITQIELDAMLEAERNELSWAPLAVDPRQKVLSHFISKAGGRVWKRTDGAMAGLGNSLCEMRLELPQASKWEELLKVVKEEEARAAAPKF
jgi:hypothetical protein